MQKHQWDEVLITIENKAGSLVSAFGIDDTAKLEPPTFFTNMRLLISDNPHREPAHSRIPREQCLTILRLVLGKLAPIHEARDDLPHVVFILRTRSKQAIDIGRISPRFDGFFSIKRRT